MKRLTDERIAALIDMVLLNEPPSTIVDIKSALVELQEYRKSDGELVAWLHINKFGTPAMTTSTKVAEDWYLNGFDVQPLYTAPQPAPIVPDLSGIDMTNIFDDEELEMMSHGNNPRSNAYRELLAFRNAMGNQAPVKQPASNANSPVIPDGYALVPVEPTPEMREAFHVANEEYEQCHYGIYSPDHQWQAMLATAPKPENAND
ncbi:hypothetical protein MP659_002672 [Salmonella enterica]|nr:hypothetical protein [Salmonella enterica]ELQ8809673.1 hypothetical protein [Salmonella enterica]